VRKKEIIHAAKRSGPDDAQPGFGAKRMCQRLTQDRWYKPKKNNDSKDSTKKCNFRSLIASKQVPTGMHKGRKKNYRYDEWIHLVISLLLAPRTFGILTRYPYRTMD
jgi:hypothetical protein